MTTRTPNGLEVVCTVHPQTGRDNCPDWKIGLQNMQTILIWSPTSKDIQHADQQSALAKMNMINIFQLLNLGVIMGDRRC